jgi:hypothetical protein
MCRRQLRRLRNGHLTMPDQSVPAQLALVQAYQQRYLAGQPPPRFRDTGFSLYSQNEEDGFLLLLFALLGTSNRTCVEMCAGNGLESNTANLILNHRWSALLFDGEKANVSTGKAFYGNHPATRHWPPVFDCEWITRDNCNHMIERRGISGEIDLFSLDIDGIDYWLWEALTVINPRVVVLEFNHLWGPDEAVTVPYSANFKAEFSQYGSDYAGASLAAFVKLGRRKNYRLIGTNAYATNAFFVRNDQQHAWLPEINPAECFDHPRAKFGMTTRLPLVRNKPWERL